MKLGIAFYAACWVIIIWILVAQRRGIDALLSLLIALILVVAAAILLNRASL